MPPKRGIVRLKDGGTKGVRQTAFSWARAQPIADARTDTIADAPADARTNADTAADRDAPADVLRADADAAADASSADVVRADAEAVADARTMDTTMNEPGADGRSDRAAPTDVRRAGTLADAAPADADAAADACAAVSDTTMDTTAAPFGSRSRQTRTSPIARVNSRAISTTRSNQRVTVVAQSDNMRRSGNTSCRMNVE